MSPPLREATAREIIEVIGSQSGKASFTTILVEAQQRGTLSWHRTLRRYLDLLVKGGVLSERERDVKSVNPQQLYRTTQKRPTIYAGPKILELHGLNWTTPVQTIYPITTDLQGLLRSRPASISGQQLLAASREDSVAHEVRRDSDKTTGTIELVTGLIATQTLDLPYLLRRSDELEVGVTLRQLFQEIIRIFTGIPQDAEGKIIIASRDRVLQVLRQYSKQKSLKLLDSAGNGTRGLKIIEALTEAQILSAIGKQLGLTG